MFPAFTRIVTKIILERINENLKSLTDREQRCSGFAYSWIDYINTLRTICVRSSDSASTTLYRFQKCFRQRQQDVHLECST